MPSCLWKVADYIDGVGTWQGTATELLSAADIEGVLPHQLTRKIVEHFDTAFTPRGICYETHRTSQARRMKFFFPPMTEMAQMTLMTLKLI